MLRIILLFIISFAIFSVTAEEVVKTAFKTKHVIILVIDGPRWTETWGEPQRQYIPVRNKELAPQGVLCMDVGNDGPTYTNAGHTALVTGFYQDINNSGREIPKNPTLFQKVIKAGIADEKTSWVVASKDKLEILTDSSATGWNHKYICSQYCGINGGGVGSGYGEDATTFAKAKEVISKQHPRFMLINFKQPDAYGHAKKWDLYLQGIRDTDRYAGDIWKLIQSDPVLKDTTTLFITNDHGRHPDGHKDGFVSHGDDCAGCKKIELLALGPDFKRGAVVEKHCGQIDVAATSAALLGLAIPGSSGRVLEELFITPPTTK